MGTILTFTWLHGSSYSRVAKNILVFIVGVEVEEVFKSYTPNFISNMIPPQASKFPRTPAKEIRNN